ncbi:MAG TPA: hypothetical protein VF510_13235 [Ktedonobacterales bacterium]
MANIGWGHGRPAESDIGILQVLLAYATQGGRLFAARRSEDNPLTLTHVRWEGQDGSMFDATRRPNDDMHMSPAEREVWVQLALAFPSAPSIQSGPHSPWQPLVLDRAQLTSWITLLKQSQASRPSYSPQPAYGGYGPPSGPAFFDPSSSSQTPWRSSSIISGAPGIGEQRRDWPAPGGNIPSTPSHTEHGETQWTGSWNRSSFEAGEVVVLPCIEVDLPPSHNNPGADEYRRDFSRDVALHFNRAARTIPQVREVRGWMRGDRMILAARLVVAMGSRPPVRAEMEGAARVLADALAQRTLPYTRLTFADPGEWMQGAPLPPE